MIRVKSQNMELVEPSIDFKNSYIEAVKEFQADAGDGSVRSRRYRDLSISQLEADFDSYVQELNAEAQGENLSEGYVPSNTYWLVDGNEFIGSISIRHRLTEYLERFGGHIGYDVRPSKRRQGYGNKILELALPKARELGIERILLTCDDTNAGSRKIIENNGGVFENRVKDPETGVDKLRFWIKTG